MLNPIQPSEHRIQSALDFQGMASLRARAQQDDAAALRETAQQFEAMFLQMLLKSMRQTIERSDLLNSESIETYEAMYDQELSVHLARAGGFGLADMLVQQMTRQTAVSPENADTLMGSSAISLNPAAPARALSSEPSSYQLDRARKAYAFPTPSTGDVNRE